MKNLTALSTVMQAGTQREVQFDCPWCGTRLALPEVDFRNEATVLCPRCNNPIDLNLQRRAAGQVGRPQPPPTLQPAPMLRKETPRNDPLFAPPASGSQGGAIPQAPQRTSPQMGGAIPQAPAPSPAPQQPARGPPASITFDPKKPINVNDYFPQDTVAVDNIDEIMSAKGSWYEQQAPRSGTFTAPSQKPEAGPIQGRMIVCPSCKYENPPVAAGFEFGPVRTCAWCGKPLPQ